MPDIALSAVCSASRTRHCATDKPSGDRDLHNPGDAERARANADCCVYAVLGALVNIVDELPGNIPVRCTDDAVSSSAVLATYCKLACTECCERVSAECPVGDDIVQSGTYTAQLPSKLPVTLFTPLLPH